MMVFLLTVEGNTDHFHDVLGVFAVEADAQEAMQEDIRCEIESGAIVEGENDEDGKLDWTRAYSIDLVEVIGANEPVAPVVPPGACACDPSHPVDCPQVLTLIVSPTRKDLKHKVEFMRAGVGVCSVTRIWAVEKINEWRASNPGVRVVQR